jgi:hypothetical protein
MIELKIKQIDPVTRIAILEAPDGFVVKVPDPLPERFVVGDIFDVDDALWQKWRDFWALGPPIAQWVEMADMKRHTYNNKVWIPLYAQHKISEVGEVGHEGFREEYFDAHGVIVPQDQQTKALDLEWMDVSVGFGHKPWVDDDNTFHSAVSYEWDDVKGANPVLVQQFEVERSTDIHINQDIILALGLKREGDVWVCPEEDYVEVIKLQRDESGEPIRVEIKAEFLKDYLCASNCGLALLTFQSRQAIQQAFSDLKWKEEDEEIEKTDRYHWSGRLRSIHEGLFPFNQGFHVLHAGRTDTDYSEDIPVYGFPTDETSYSESYNVEPKGRKLVHAIGEIWKREWITPSAKSPRVRRDKVPSKIEFIVDNEGNTETSGTLSGPSRWLWFHPNVITDLLKKRAGVLSWYTRDTGNVGGAWNRSVHFGVNSIGLINVYAKDIGQMRETDKKTWATHNVSPEGGVSAELLMSQMQARPAVTIAPEQSFFSLIEEIQNISKAKLETDLFRGHSSEKDIMRKIHRFQASNLEGFYLLCKEITRFLIERIDMDFLKKIKKEDEKLGTLKRLEKILTALSYDGRSIVGVLVGVYELRLADAHLPSTDKIMESMKLVGVDYEDLKFNSGKRLIENVNTSLIQIKEAFDKGDFTKVS